jgi:hypothetical protein
MNKFLVRSIVWLRSPGFSLAVVGEEHQQRRNKARGYGLFDDAFVYKKIIAKNRLP